MRTPPGDSAAMAELATALDMTCKEYHTAMKHLEDVQLHIPDFS